MTIIHIYALGAAVACAVAMSGCAAVQEWDQTHEREYRAEYHQGGGAVSMTVRPWKGGTLRGQGKMVVPSWNADLPQPGGLAR